MGLRGWCKGIAERPPRPLRVHPSKEGNWLAIPLRGGVPRRGGGVSTQAKPNDAFLCVLCKGLIFKLY